ncbi:aldehyde dehydrogenase family protein [Lichenicoccus sp.]|uniref:aldehyde dehydrogenase family protein n=1 Tax=Lichenicoccus sp. TaxID=2781899 RepID=UPI003D0CE67C
MTDSLRQSLASQRQAAARDPYPPLAARREALGRLETLLRGNVEALHQAICDDFCNRARPETILAEIMPVLDAIGHARARMPRWMRPRRHRVGPRFWPGQAWTVIQPLGCIGIVSPWNYPLLLSLMPMVDALAAGNRVMLKPSEHAPRCADLLADLLSQHFAPESVCVVTGDAEVGRAFCALPFDHLLFTGSTGVGRHVMQAAAAGLVPVTLELGGKCPAILCADAVSDTATLAHTAHSLAVGKFFNAGQTCLAPDYVLVPRAQLAQTASALMQAASTLYPTLADNPDYTGIITAAHYERLRALVADAEPTSASVLRHAEDRPDRQAQLASQRKLPPIILCAPDPCSEVMREEIFGPILPVLGYDSLEEAIAFVNARPSPLALYCYSEDPALQRLVLSRTRSGGATLNGTLLHGGIPALPFGGVGASGTGLYHGEAGFLRFSHQRAIYRPGRFSGFTWLSPPHGVLMRRSLALMLKQR